MKHLMIPDVQAKPGAPTKHLRHIGQLIMDELPDVIVCIGDFADMHSLSSYDRGKKCFEGRRYKEDLKASNQAMDVLLKPMRDHNKLMAKHKKKRYKPRMVMTLGNHENRINRAVEAAPELDGAIGVHDLGFERHGWEVYDFLVPVTIDGITYSHYFTNDFSPHPIGRAHLIAQKHMTSCTAGHKQMLDYSISQHKVGGRRVQCLIAGAAYMHDEEYRTAQGQDHWRGVIVKHDVVEGEYDPHFISLESLARKYK